MVLEIFVTAFALMGILAMGISVFWCFHKLFGQYAADKK